MTTGMMVSGSASKGLQRDLGPDARRVAEGDADAEVRNGQ